MNNSDRWYSCPTQIYWTCKALIEGRTIGHTDEIVEANGWRLAAIVWKLKRNYGWPIVTTYTGPESVAEYKLDAGVDRSRLEFPPSAQHLKGNWGSAA